MGLNWTPRDVTWIVESPSLLSLLLNYACSSATDMETLKENPGDVSITLPGSSMTTTYVT